MSWANPRSGRGLLNDAHCGLGQQMFFWGRDVVCGGHLLLKYGFQRVASPGHQGTSCYRKSWGGGVVELHGHCVGWYPERSCELPGFLFVRNRQRSYVNGRMRPMIPGCYEGYTEPASFHQHSLAARHFASWLVEYEGWILQSEGSEYREACFSMFQKLPASKPWLPPQSALEWWAAFAQQDAGLMRARAFG
jgi:hypothetical protein